MVFKHSKDAILMARVLVTHVYPIWRAVLFNLLRFIDVSLLKQEQESHLKTKTTADS